MTFRANGAKLKYEFLVRPGGNPSAIRLAYAGAGAPAITGSGALSVATAVGPLTDSRPYSYQQAGGRRVSVRSRFVLRNGRSYGFAVAGHDVRRPLVIDPDLAYSTFLGGRSTDEPWGIDVDAQGQAYVVGITHSEDFPTTPGAFQTTPRSYNTFVTKLSDDGSALEYSTFLVGSQYEEARAIAVDDQGNAFVSGFTTSPDFPTTPSAYDTSHNGSYDTFLTKLNATGSGLLYSTYLGGSSVEGATAIAVDRNGSAYLTGNTSSVDHPTTPGAYQTTNNGGDDVFLTRFTPDGSQLVYSTLLGSSGFSEFAYSLGIDAAGNAYTTGRSDSASFPTTPGAFDPDMERWRRRLPEQDQRRRHEAARVDISRRTRDSRSGRAPPRMPPINHTSLGLRATLLASRRPQGLTTQRRDGQDGFLAKLDPGLSRLTYSTFLGGNRPGGTFGGHSLEVDARGRAHVTGTGGTGIFVKQVRSDGLAAHVFSRCSAASSLETSAGIALGDGARDAYVSGIDRFERLPHDGRGLRHPARWHQRRIHRKACARYRAARLVQGLRQRARSGPRTAIWPRSTNSVRAPGADAKGKVQYLDRGPAAALGAPIGGYRRACLPGRKRDDHRRREHQRRIRMTSPSTWSTRASSGRTDTYRLQLSNGYDSGTQTLAGGTSRSARASQPLKRFVIGSRRSRPNARGVILMPGRRLAALVLRLVDHADHAAHHVLRHPSPDQLLWALVLLHVRLQDRVEQVVGREGVGVLLTRLQLGRRRSFDDPGGIRACHGCCGSAPVGRRASWARPSAGRTRRPCLHRAWCSRRSTRSCCRW